MGADASAESTRRGVKLLSVRSNYTHNNTLILSPVKIGFPRNRRGEMLETVPMVSFNLFFTSIATSLLFGAGLLRVCLLGAWLLVHRITAAVAHRPHRVKRQ